MPDIVIRSTSAWSRDQIDAYLKRSEIPIRFACLARDAPLICSLWYLYEDGQFWLATQQGAAVVDYVRANANCGIEIAHEDMPYRGVRGQGTARLDAGRGGEILERLVRRYLGNCDSDFARWLLARSEDEVAIAVRPDWLTSWDFSRRMSGASAKTPAGE